MKKIILIILVLQSSYVLFSQTIDSAGIIVVYKLTYLPDTSNVNRYKTDILYLQIGEKVSSFFSYNKFRTDSMYEESVNTGTQEQFIKDPNLRNKFGVIGPYSNFKLLINYPETKITVKDEIFGSSKFIYEEEIEKINWLISLDTMSIFNSVCQKATADFRGRKYIAWFSPQIPLNAGPYKFSGLPGLILKISDIKDNYRYECVEIKVLNDRIPIVNQNKDYIKTTRKEFRKIFQEGFRNPVEFLKLNGVSISVNGQNYSQGNINLQKGLPYNPIELE